MVARQACLTTLRKQPPVERGSEFHVGFRNEFGCLRVALVRKYLSSPENFDIGRLCAAYGEWVDTDEWLHLKMNVKLSDGSLKSEDVFVPCLKRGNDQYQKFVNRRIAEMGDFSRFSFPVDGARNKALQTRVLFVTLSQDVNRFGGRYKDSFAPAVAWKKIGPEFNKWCSAIRQKFGEFAMFRVWESTELGFPHVHVIMVFKKTFFSGFMHNGKLRVRGKKFFERCWHSFVDVQGVLNFKRGMAELLKYLKKDVGYGKERRAFLNSPKGLKTLALTWFFNKRSFAVSGFFRDLTMTMHNSNLIVRVPRFFQSDLCGLVVVRVWFELIEVLPAHIVAELGGL